MTEFDETEYERHLSIFRWDPRDHPRDWLGRFREVINSLKDGDTVELPDGTYIDKANGKYVVGKPDTYPPPQVHDLEDEDEEVVKYEVANEAVEFTDSLTSEEKYDLDRWAKEWPEPGGIDNHEDEPGRPIGDLTDEDKGFTFNPYNYPMASDDSIPDSMVREPDWKEDRPETRSETIERLERLEQGEIIEFMDADQRVYNDGENYGLWEYDDEEDVWALMEMGNAARIAGIMLDENDGIR